MKVLLICAIFLLHHVQGLPTAATRSQDSCINMNEEKEQEIDTIVKKLSRYLDTIAQEHEDFDVAFVRIAIEKHSEDEKHEEKGTLVQLSINDCSHFGEGPLKYISLNKTTSSQKFKSLKRQDDRLTKDNSKVKVVENDIISSEESNNDVKTSTVTSSETITNNSDITKRRGTEEIIKKDSTNRTDNINKVSKILTDDVTVTDKNTHKDKRGDNKKSTPSKPTYAVDEESNGGEQAVENKNDNSVENTSTSTTATTVTSKNVKSSQDLKNSVQTVKKNDDKPNVNEKADSSENTIQPASSKASEEDANEEELDENEDLSDDEEASSTTTKNILNTNINKSTASTITSGNSRQNVDSKEDSEESKLSPRRDRDSQTRVWEDNESEQSHDHEKLDETIVQGTTSELTTKKNLTVDEESNGGEQAVGNKNYNSVENTSTFTTATTVTSKNVKSSQDLKNTVQTVEKNDDKPYENEKLDSSENTNRPVSSKASEEDTNEEELDENEDLSDDEEASSTTTKNILNTNINKSTASTITSGNSRQNVDSKEDSEESKLSPRRDRDSQTKVRKDNESEQSDDLEELDETIVRSTTSELTTKKSLSESATESDIRRLDETVRTTKETPQKKITKPYFINGRPVSAQAREQPAKEDNTDEKESIPSSSELPIKPQALDKSTKAAEGKALGTSYVLEYSNSPDDPRIAEFTRGPKGKTLYIKEIQLVLIPKDIDMRPSKDNVELLKYLQKSTGAEKLFVLVPDNNDEYLLINDGEQKKLGTVKNDEFTSYYLQLDELQNDAGNENQSAEIVKEVNVDLSDVLVVNESENGGTVKNTGAQSPVAVYLQKTPVNEEEDLD